MLWLPVLGAILVWAAPPGVAVQRPPQRGNNFQISPKPCAVNGVKGTCMFVYECIQSRGRHVGMCVDTFMFGSCCSNSNTDETSAASAASASEPAVLYSAPSSNKYSPDITSRPPSGAPSSNKYSPDITSRPPSGAPSSNKYSSTAITNRPPSGVSTGNKHNANRPSSGVGNKYSTYRPPSGLVSTGNKYSTAMTHGPPSHGANSSSYTTSSHKFKPSHNNVDKTQATNHKFTARPPPSPVSNHIVSSSSSNSRPNFISSSGSSAKYPSYHHADGKPYRPAHNGYSSLSAKPPGGGDTLNSIQNSEKPGKPTLLSQMPASRPSSVMASRPTPANQTNWGMSPPISDTLSTAGSSLITMWTSSDKFPTSMAWQVTTEPTFVTRPRPRPPLRLRPTRRPPQTTPPPTTTSTTTTSTTTTTTPSTTTTSTTTTTTTTTPPPPPPPPPPPSTTEEETMTSTASSVSASSGDRPVQCGVPALTARPEMRIVGGRNAPFGGWPWQVSVRRTSFFGFSSTHRCGGAVLNENWIATAGHCVDDLLTSQIRIRVGEYDFSSVQEPHPFIERAVARKVVHPKYNFFTYEYDLALVRLEAALEFAPHVSPICLPASDDLLIGEDATVTGWGRLSEGGTLPSVLQEVSVPIVSNEQCKSMFLRAGRHEFIPEIFLCAGYEKGGQDSCQGDSGGPLQVRGKDGRYFLAGIISWGIGCAEANLPGVCTRISKFVHWILENVT